MRPIGYWLNRTDQAITRHMDAMLRDRGLDRLAWQVLNLVNESGECPDAHVLTTLRANAGRPALEAAVATVLDAGWATRPAPGTITLTDTGRHHLAGVRERVSAFRELSTEGISQADYDTTIAVLRRMTRNLDAQSEVTSASA
ncbi:hypothetical protein OIE66_16115 [Nonomuraea sp. NBC_01738]|uniref:hypothetical protein n=1 Tax=Nonomuraea sp. NBC_01738 TaxID=2976003 RepID=UPI002E1625C1|nr:hypothetical protein OIE66_16115 [Nonomuraea sp. NBC_01738]